MHHALLIIIATIALSTLLNVFLKRYDIPTVIGYVFTGLVITSVFHFASEQREFLSHLAEFGIVFLMFTVGLEFSFRHLKSMKKEVFVIGGLQMVVTGAVLSFAGHHFFGLGVKTSIVVGLALSLSSTAIVLKMLNENGDIHSSYGKYSLGVLLFQDLAVIPILLMVSFFTSSDKSVSTMLIDTLGGAVVIFAGLFIFGKYIAERFFGWVTRSNSEEIFLVSVFLVVISASFFAEAVGFTYSLGAFLAGMLLAETKYRYRIEADLVPFRDILLGVFFVTIGMLIDWHSIVDYSYYIIGVTFLIMAAKGTILFVVMKQFAQKRTAVKTSATLFQVGEFALAIFALAGSKGIISAQANQILIISVVLSMVVTPFVIKNVRKIANMVEVEPETSYPEAPIVAGTYHNHYIVCGFGPIGKNVAQQLKEAGDLYVVLEHDGNIVEEELCKREHPIFLANAAQRSTFSNFNAKNCKAVIVAIENEIQRRLICENILSFGGNVRSVVKVNNDIEAEIYRDMGISSVINGKQIVSDLLFSESKNI